VQVLDREINILTTSIASGIEGTLSPRVMSTIKQTPTPEVIEPVYIENTIPFSDPDSQDVLLESWKWLQGEAENSEYRIASNNLTLVAGPRTILQDRRQSAPQVEYQLSGNFQIYVKLNFDPTERDQMAGIGLRSIENPDTWIALRRGYYYDQRIDVLRNSNGEPQEIINIPYIKKSTCLLIKRQDENISFAISENCKNWVDIKNNFTFSLPDTVNIFLFTFSTTSNGISAEFSDLIIGEPTERIVTMGNGTLSFFDDNIALNEMWSWFPGGSETDDFQINQDSETLSIISGPRVNLSQNTAPRIMLLTAGDFTADVNLSFDPIERDQIAGIGIASTEELNTWITLRRAYYYDQRLDINQRMNGSEVYINNIPYTEREIKLRIQRNGNLINTYYSSDGTSWIPMAENYVMSFPDQVYVFLYTYSTNQKGVIASFSGFKLNNR
jgi:regulation of enolase protein 1 (concanavalin A-like superfamily)